jgi:hypothetical protein
MLLLTCSQCEAVLKSGEMPAGRRARCPRCGSVITVSQQEQPAQPSLYEEPEISTEPYAGYEPKERPQRRRRCERRVSLRLWCIAGGGAFLVLVGLAVLLLVWAWGGSSPRELIVGTWQTADQPSAGTIEFRRDGTFIARSTGTASISAKYRFLDDKTLEIEVPNPLWAAQEAIFAKLPRAQQQQQTGPLLPETLRGTLTIVKVTRTDLVTHTANDGTKRFKRVR